MFKKIAAFLTAGAILFSGNALAINANAFSAESINENTQIVSATYGDLEYSILDDGTIEITDCNSSVVSVDIPAEIDGKKVTSIGNHAFSGCKSLESIDIPNSVTSIRDYAFMDCTALTTVNFNGTLNELGYDIFESSAPFFLNQKGAVYFGNWVIGYNDDDKNAVPVEIKDGTVGIKEYSFYFEEISEIILPDTLKIIEPYAFSYCDNVTKINIPASVEEIGASFFHSSDGLREINVDENNPYYCSDDGILFNKDKTIFVRCPSRKFWLGDEYCIPDTVKEISPYAFENCWWLSKIVIPDGVSELKEGTFHDCVNAEEIVIPDSVVSIEDAVFYNCPTIKELNISANVENIVCGQHFFWNCASQYINGVGGHVPNSLEAINVSADNKNYSSLDGALFDKEKKVLLRCPTAKKNCYVIPDTVEKIYKFAFGECEYLKSIYIPVSVTLIENYTFEENITDIYYAGSEEQWNAISGVEGNDFSNVTIHYNSKNTTPEESYDVNGDGTIDISDASAILSDYAYLLAGLPVSDSHAKMDIDGDGAVTISDATSILKYYAYTIAGLDLDV